MTELELNKISFQLDSWKRFKWEPEWFNAKKINIEIFDKIIKFQKSFLHNKCDGFVDYKTYEIIYSKASALIKEKTKIDITNSIIAFNSLENTKLQVINKTYQSSFVAKEYQLYKQEYVDKIIVSFGNTYSAKAYQEIMKNKKTVCHFVIDMNGIVTQFLDTSIQSNDDSEYNTNGCIMIKLLNPLLLGKYDQLIQQEVKDVKIKSLDNNVNLYSFTESQIQALLHLINKLTYVHSIPFKAIKEKTKGVFVENHIFCDDIKNQLP